MADPLKVKDWHPTTEEVLEMVQVCNDLALAFEALGKLLIKVVSDTAKALNEIAPKEGKDATLE